MNITAAEVMKLRETTGLGMMICKKALIEANGDTQLAIENLRKQGQVTADKRSGKAAKEGRVEIIIKDSTVLMYEVNAETDFVARNQDFLSFASGIGTILLEKKPKDLNAALALSSPVLNGQTIEAKTLELVAKIGEKISFRRFYQTSIDKARERAFSYIHGNGKIGVIVIVSVDKSETLDTPQLMELGKDLAMQIAASRPIAVDRTSVPQTIIAKEKEIYREQVKLSGKPEAIWDKIVDGKLDKYYKQSVLMEQEYIKDTEINVSTRIKQTNKELDTTVSVTSFVRYELGAEE